ncbi:MAG: hypothetical protein US50_C0004G0028 [Candidatus Nomurabacteria bacterium GW2011_GWB1_37_5]|uniref:Transcription regulator TrmB N-terminal domain-containing protein n=1 Tax=Candidatus Nomurabacteria bacterium GW2011_GWB1_37_5 TaxID=1618742 RepID=A0A0G0JGD8_9BACT|nr:MAG: hypothetical protein US50_C0004G0028 [Candidatus Nomurabacteria bacterium GW2011_GWB1_37_5]
MDKLEKILKNIGFNKTEIEIYIFLLKRGPSSVSQISRSLGIHRPIVYRTLDPLKEKGVITMSPKGKQKLYSAEKPEVIINILKDISSKFESLLPEIEDLYSKKIPQPEIKYMEGRKGIAYVFNDVVNNTKRGETFYRYTSEKDLKKVNSYLPKDYRERRDAKKLERLVISNPASGSQKRSRLERFIKFIPPECDQFEQNIIELIYGDKVAFIDLNSETSFIIENKSLAEFQKTIFKLLYKKLD